MHSFLSFVRNLSLCLDAQPQFFFLELQKSTPPEQGSGNTVAGSWDWGLDVMLRALKSLIYGQANCLRLFVLTLCQLFWICKCKSQESIRILWNLLTLWFHFWAFKSILHLKELRISCSLFQFKRSWWLDGFYLLGAKSSLILRILWRSTHLSWLVLDRFENFEVFWSRICFEYMTIL